jgi:hypothetical protein
MEKHKDLFFTNLIQIIEETEKMMLESMNIKEEDYENWKIPGTSESGNTNTSKAKLNFLSNVLH